MRTFHQLIEQLQGTGLTWRKKSILFLVSFVSLLPALNAQVPTSAKLESIDLYATSPYVLTVSLLQPNAYGHVYIDTSPGPTYIPGIGTLHLGFTSNLMVRPFRADKNGVARVYGGAIDPSLIGRPWYAQAMANDTRNPTGMVLSNPCSETVAPINDASFTPTYPRLFTLGFTPEESDWSQGTKHLIETEHNQVVVWRPPYGGRHIAPAKAANPNVRILATIGRYLVGDPNKGQNEDPNQFYLKDSGGNINWMFPPFEDSYCFNASQWGATVDTGHGPENAVQYIARKVMDQMNVPNYDWDGVGHDAFWLGLWNTNNTDYNKNGVNDMSEGYQRDQLFLDGQNKYMRALMDEFEQRTQRKPVVYYNAGNSDSWGSDQINAAMVEDFAWGGHWSKVFKLMQTWGYSTPILPRIGMMFALGAAGWAERELNYVPVVPDPTHLSSDAAVVHTVNLQNNFQRVRFGLTMSLMGNGYFTYDYFEHNLSWYYDEYKFNLGYPLSDYTQIRVGPQPVEINPNTEDLGSIFVRFFEKGVAVHYAPPNGNLNEITVTEQHLRTAATQLGLRWDLIAGDNGHYYRILGNQAPLTVQTDNSSPSFTTQGSWVKTQARHFKNGNNLAVWGGDSIAKEPGNGSGKAIWSFTVPKTDDYRLVVNLAYDNNSTLKDLFTYDGFTTKVFATNAPYRITHAGGVANMSIDQTRGRGHSLGAYRFNAGQTYTVELSDAANGLVYADALVLDALHARFNDGAQFDSSRLYGGVSSMGPVGNWGNRHIVGDGIVLARAANTVAMEPIIVGNYPIQDTSCGTREAKYSGTWNHVATRSSSIASEENPYYATLVWNAFITWVGTFYSYGYREAQPNSGATATYTPTIGTGGVYRVYEWHGWRGDRESSLPEATNVPWSLKVNGQTVGGGTINQSSNKGRWNLLGTFTLPSGTATELILATNGADAPVISDAMKFEYVSQ